MMGKLVFDSVKCHQIVSVPGYCVWCSSMTRTSDGKCHLFLSMWEEKWGFEHGWSMHSQIGYAVSDEPGGKYEYKGIILSGSGKENGWDRDSVHNPYVIYCDGRFYVFYSGNYGDGIMTTHTRNQKIGVAYTDNPLGEWTRFDEPIFKMPSGEVCPYFSSNPSICKTPDGRYILVYKLCDRNSGNVIISAAFANHPLGPWIFNEKPIFEVPGVQFAAEDPCVYSCKDKLYCMLHDMKNYYIPDKIRAIIKFESDDGISWRPSDPLCVCSREIEFEGEGRKELFRLERPFLYLENDEPKAFFAGARPSQTEQFSYNIHMNVSESDTSN